MAHGINLASSVGAGNGTYVLVEASVTVPSLAGILGVVADDIEATPDQLVAVVVEFVPVLSPVAGIGIRFDCYGAEDERCIERWAIHCVVPDRIKEVVMNNTREGDVSCTYIS